jgi:hypothetical protein
MRLNISGVTNETYDLSEIGDRIGRNSNCGPTNEIRNADFADSTGSNSAAYFPIVATAYYSYYDGSYRPTFLAG